MKRENIRSMTYIKGNHDDAERVAIEFVNDDGAGDRIEVNAYLIIIGIADYRSGNGHKVNLSPDVRLDVLLLIAQEREKILAAFPVKTRQGWRYCGFGDFKEYCFPGDKVDQKMFDYFLDSMPPESYRAGYLQAGEPYSDCFDENGRLRATYTTFCKKDGAWVYVGDCFSGEDINRSDTTPRLQNAIISLTEGCDAK